jgi:hypothetical protein
MIENKLYIKLLSLKGIAAGLSSLNNLAAWCYIPADNSGLFPGYSPASFFGKEESKTNEEAKPDTGNLSGLKEAVMSFGESIKNMSSRLQGFSPKPSGSVSGKTMVVPVFERNVFKVRGEENNKLKFSGMYAGLLGAPSKDRNSGGQFTPGTNAFKSIFIKEGQDRNEKNVSEKHSETFYHLHDVTNVIQKASVHKEKLLDADILRKLAFREKPSAERPSHTIHQTFGDIVLQPGSMDVSMQQLKVKIQDILKQARDSMY